MRSRFQTVLFPIFAIILLACRFSASNQSSTTFTLKTDTPRQLATPYADSPAAGICPLAPDPVVTVNIGPGPDPMPEVRCIQVHKDQSLKLVNRTDGVIQVAFGGFDITLEPNSEHLLDSPFGDYLEVGVHVMSISAPFFGPEIWLVQE